jgi:hypothetical protein
VKYSGKVEEALKMIALKIGSRNQALKIGAIKNLDEPLDCS